MSLPPILAAAQSGDWDKVRRLVTASDDATLAAAVRARASSSEDGHGLAHYLASSGPLDLLERLVLTNAESILSRNRIQQTPLACALLRTDAEGIAVVRFLLAQGAARSVFVSGYAADSLVVTLPMARKPVSQAVSLPAPAGVSDEALAAVDVALAAHVGLLELRFHNTRVPAPATLLAADAAAPPPPVPAPALAAVQAALAAFDPLPVAGLSVGDIVKVRGGGGRR